MRTYLRRDISFKVSRYSYPINVFSGMDAYSEENALPLNKAVYGYNVSTAKGVLKNGAGISLAHINGNNLPGAGVYGYGILKMYLYRRYDYELCRRDDKLIVLLSDKKVYKASLDDPSFTPTTMQFNTDCVNFLNYHYNGVDCLLAYGVSGEAYVYDGTTATAITAPPKFCDVCVHYERVYGVENDGNNRLYYSKALDPSDFSISATAGGYISFPDEGGNVMRVISFKGSVYIFREYAIHRLTAYADQSDYVLSKVFLTNNLIYGKTACVCNGRIIFLAEDGFYSFDGNSCTKILKNIFPLLDDKTFATACFANDKYYLAAAVKRDDETIGDERYTLKNNAIIIVDFETENGVSIFRGADVREFLPINLDYANEIFLCFNNLYRALIVGMIDEGGTLFGAQLKKKWQSPYTDLEYINKDKVLRRVFIANDSPMTLKIHLENDKEYNVSSVTKAQMIPINAKADKIGLVLTTTANTFCVRGMLLEFDLIRRNIND